jgi:hypothetical protein
MKISLVGRNIYHITPDDLPALVEYLVQQGYNHEPSAHTPVYARLVVELEPSSRSLITTFNNGTVRLQGSLAGITLAEEKLQAITEGEMQ